MRGSHGGRLLGFGKLWKPSKVAPEARAALVAYQREAADVLYRHFLAPPAPATAPGALPLDMGAKLKATRARLIEAMWALNLPTREAPGASLREREGGEVSLEELCADVAHLSALLGFEPSGEMPDGIILPTIDHRSQIVLRLRAWMAACTRPLTHEERQMRQGVTARQAADSYNRWAHARNLSPMSAESLGRWLANPALCGYQRILSRKGHRYELALLPAPAPVAQLPGRSA
jgi:hypothetical protein